MNKLKKTIIEQYVEETIEENQDIQNDDIDFEYLDYVNDCISSLMYKNDSEKFKNTKLGSYFKEDFFLKKNDYDSKFKNNSFFYGFLMQLSFKYEDIINSDNFIYNYIKNFEDIKDVLGLEFILRVKFLNTDFSEYESNYELFSDVFPYSTETNWALSEIHSYEELCEKVNEIEELKVLDTMKRKLNYYCLSTHPLVLKNNISVSSYLDNIDELFNLFNSYNNLENIIEY